MIFKKLILENFKTSKNKKSKNSELGILNTRAKPWRNFGGSLKIISAHCFGFAETRVARFNFVEAFGFNFAETRVARFNFVEAFGFQATSLPLFVNPFVKMR